MRKHKEVEKKYKEKGQGGRKSYTLVKIKNMEEEKGYRGRKKIQRKRKDMEEQKSKQERRRKDS